jgi:dual specificity tyrosine-phosphorylation-regulated kinase 2/3/4
LDHKRKEEVAVKIIRNKRRFHQQGAVEIKILEILRDNDLEDTMGIVRMKNYIKFRKHICVTFEMLSINLYEFLKMNSFQGVNLSLVRRFAVQILISLKYTTELKVIHCDLKPENILLRNPDTPSIDMWSLGCILAELFYGYPLFPGESEKEQMQYIMEVLGLPPAHLLERSTRKKLFFEENGEVKLPANSRGRVHKPGTKTLEQAVRCQDRLFLDFIGRCLDWDPATRLRPEEALQHPWVLETAKPAGKEASRLQVTRGK